MKKLLLGTVAINLTFISALALSSVGPNHDTHATAQDLNEINANTTGAITLDGGEDSGEGEESDEGEGSLGELPDGAGTNNLEITVSDEGDPE